MAKMTMVGKIPTDRWNPAGLEGDVEFAGEGVSLADMVLGFFEEGEGLPERCGNDGENEDGDGEDGQNSGGEVEKKAFWLEQDQLLKGILCRSSSLESRIRHDTEQALRESRSVGPVCVCPRPVTGGCRNCLLRDVSERLRNAGFESHICKSKWRRSPDIPSGEHTYIDVMATSAKKAMVRVIIELDFRAEFEMARASPEYNGLIDHLPQVFVGKAERLRTMIKILCGAAKKCMKENKMHMGPWRKHKYMEAKWLGTCERIAPVPLFSTGFSDRQRKLKASMLTFDLVEKLPSLHCTAVEVV
ncbi:uncharacterized protein LOC131240899 [Magnolia sinica]|uniref:uncharacterized protein LOC131240899 n=1 Tax=Magnolia sinica TaxID=86752 RepID=UPI00265AF572|nr:uncharacterized protein LOC131240899 [Magnolia sinica]